MDKLETMLAQAELQENSNEQWELLDDYGTREFYSDEHGHVRVTGKSIEDISENISVSGEDNSQYIEFRMNRFYDGVDLSKLFISIHYEAEGSGDEGSIVNVYRSADEIKFGWVVPAAVTQYSEIEFCIWVRGVLEDNSNYILKTLPKVYTINRGLVLGGGIPEPQDNWYLNFVKTMDSKLADTRAYANLAKSSASEAKAASQDVDTKASQVDIQHSEVKTWHDESKQYSESAKGSAEDAKEYYENTKNISESLSGALKPMGTIAFSQLPALSEALAGDMYNISDQFVTTEDFREGAGRTIPLGSNIYKTSDGKWDVLAGSPVTGIKGSAEEEYRSGNVDITPENIGLGNVQSDIALNRQTLGYVKKNLLKNTATTKTVNGVTFTVNEDGSVTVNGTASATATFIIGYMSIASVGVGNYIFAGNYTNSYITTAVDLNLNNVWKETRGIDGRSFEISDGDVETGYIFTFYIRVNNGKTVNNTTVYPMLRSADIIDGTYEPYVDDVDTRLKKLTPVNNLLATEPGSPLDATMGKALNDKIETLGGFTPVIDETTGKITGYKTTIGGEDTVFPFRSATYCGNYKENGSFDISEFGLQNVAVGNFIFVPTRTNTTPMADAGVKLPYTSYVYIRPFGNWYKQKFTLDGNILTFTLPRIRFRAYSGPTADNASAAVDNEKEIYIAGDIYYLG